MITHFIEHENIIYDILIGKNAKENWNLIDNADDFDLWLHIDNMPSCHVIVKERLQKNNNNLDNKNVNDNYGYPVSVIKIAGRLCKLHTTNSTKNVNIVYTTINNVSKGKHIGSVNITCEEYIMI